MTQLDLSAAAISWPSDDPQFGKVFVDIDEMRETPRPHRYVHGGWEGGPGRFSFYFIPPELFRGRYLLFLGGGAGGYDNLLTFGNWEFDLAYELGAYLFETNISKDNHSGLGTDNALSLWQTSAQGARVGRALAKQIYSRPTLFGYVYGPSGGGLRSRMAIENAPDMFQGAVPIVAGMNQLAPWSAQGLAMALISDEQIRRIVDASEVGGTGRVFDGLSTVQREALANLYRSGWPRGAESQLARMPQWPFALIAMGDTDPAYFEDFWTKPGYAGHDGETAIKPFDEVATVKQVLTLGEMAERIPGFRLIGVASDAAMKGILKQRGHLPGQAVILDHPEPERLFMARLTILTGKGKGREIYIAIAYGNVLKAFAERAGEAFADVEPGDRVRLDNRDWIAWMYAHRYVLDGAFPDLKSSASTMLEEHAPWYLDGEAIYPQRKIVAQFPASGRFDGKVIELAGLHDPFIYPHSALPFRRLVANYHGSRADEHYRFWFMEHATHGSPTLVPAGITPEKDPDFWATRLIDFNGITAQAIRDVVAWVENGVEPPSNSNYELTRDNQVLLPLLGRERGGIQPVVTVTANGGTCAEVAVGELVEFQAIAEVPLGSGNIMQAQWNFIGQGPYQDPIPIKEPKPVVKVSATHTYDKPGTYFVAFLVGSLRDGVEFPTRLANNLGRARVIVR